jgi:hypothetical protein
MVENAYRTILTNINISTKTAMTAHAVPIVRLLVLTLCREYVMMEAVNERMAHTRRTGGRLRSIAWPWTPRVCSTLCM